MATTHSSANSMSPNDLRSEITRLQEQHSAFDVKLEDFNDRAYLTPAQQIERKRIKKQKLRIKDRVSQLNRALQALGA